MGVQRRLRVVTIVGMGGPNSRAIVVLVKNQGTKLPTDRETTEMLQKCLSGSKLKGQDSKITVKQETWESTMKI